MNIITRIIDLVTANPDATVIKVTPRQRAEIRRECGPVLAFYRDNDGSAPEDQIMGLKLVTKRPSMYCRCCGAPALPGVCTYCKAPSDLIELE